MDEAEAAVIAAAEQAAADGAADAVPDAFIPIPDGTYGGATFKGCWIEVRHEEARTSSVVKVGEPITLAPGARLDGADWDVAGTCKHCDPDNPDCPDA